MKDVKTELAEAYGAKLDSEIEALEREAAKEPHEFSADFEACMDKLIKGDAPREKKPAVRVKRALIIAAAALLAIAATACAVPQIRSSIAGFLVKVFGDHVEYTDPAVEKQTIEEEYALSPVPEGFALKLDCRTEADYFATYMDASGFAIMLQQAAGDNISERIYADTENFTEREIGGKQVRVHYSEGFAQAAWIEDGYFFSLAYTGSVEPETFESWIGAVKVK